MAEPRIGRPPERQPDKEEEAKGEEREEEEAKDEEAIPEAAPPTTVVVLVTQLGYDYSYGAQIAFADLDTETGGGAQALLESGAVVDIADPAAQPALAAAAHVARMEQIAARNRGVPQ